jgi:SAM-dependent methyltransferase
MNHLKEDLRWLNFVRDTEFDSALQILKGLEINNVLELGSGTGYILGKLNKVYPNVLGLEVEGSSYTRLDQGIKIYDGVNIPKIDELKYDLIISFHVLEHATDLDGLLSNCYDVLAKDGVMIHVLPSSTWRFLTTIFWPLGGLFHIFRRILFKSNEPIAHNTLDSKVRWRWLISRAIPKAHGERGNALTEIYYFGRIFWTKIFKKNKFLVVDVLQSNIVYWGNDFMRHGLNYRCRNLFSRIIGSSSNIYIVKKASANQDLINNC